MKKRIISFLLLLTLLCSLNVVYAEELTQTMTPFISVTHDDGNESRFTSTDVTQPVTMGGKGYSRRQITVLDLNQLEIPDGMTVDTMIYSLYCTVSYELVDNVIGVWALDFSGIDLSSTPLTYQSVPANGEMIASFDMPARVNGATYQKYIDFDISDYVKTAIAAGRRYVGFAVQHTVNCKSGGMFVETTYGANPPKVTYSLRKLGVVAKSHNVMAEKNGTQQKTVNTAPWFSASHWDADESKYTSTTEKNWAINMGGAGYRRRVITVLDLSAWELPENTVLEECIYSLYGIASYDTTEKIVGVWALDISNVDMSEGLKYADVPNNGALLASINMPAKDDGGGTYKKYMDFNLTEYINQAITAGQRYVAFAVQQTTSCKGGLNVDTSYSANPPKISLKYQETISGKVEQNILCEGELEYNVTLLNETNETKQVRLLWAQVQGNVCTKVVAGEVVSLEANAEQTVTLTQAVTDTNSTVRFFAVEDIGTVVRPLVDEKYELTKDGWK